MTIDTITSAVGCSALAHAVGNSHAIELVLERQCLACAVGKTRAMELVLMGCGARHAKFGWREVNIGTIMSTVGRSALAHAMGNSRAIELVLERQWVAAPRMCCGQVACDGARPHGM